MIITYKKMNDEALFSNYFIIGITFFMIEKFSRAVFPLSRLFRVIEEKMKFEDRIVRNASHYLSHY